MFRAIGEQHARRPSPAGCLSSGEQGKIRFPTATMGVLPGGSHCVNSALK
jgi:hypothetical protein